MMIRMINIITVIVVGGVLRELESGIGEVSLNLFDFSSLQDF